MTYRRTIYATEIRTNKNLESFIYITTGKLKMDNTPGYFFAHVIPLREFLERTGLSINQHVFIIESDLLYTNLRANDHPGEWEISWLYNSRDQVIDALRGMEEDWLRVVKVRNGETKTGIPSLEFDVEQNSRRLFYLTSRLIRMYNLNVEQLELLVGAYVRPTFARKGDRSYGGFEFPEDNTYVVKLEVAFESPPIGLIR
jgi:hypothetical protein